MNEIKYQFNEQEEMSNKELLSIEKEMLGIYLSGHPLEKLRNQIMEQTTINSMDLRAIEEQMSSNLEDLEMVATRQSAKSKYKDGQSVKYAGIITSIKKKYTKNNKIMAFVTVEDLYGTVEVIVFENAYVNAGRSLVEENIVKVEGRLSIREDDATTIIANEIKDFGEPRQRIFTLDITDVKEEQKEKLRGALRYFSGDKNNMNVQIKIGEETKPCGQIYLTDQIVKIFEDILEKERVYLSSDERDVP